MVGTEYAYITKYIGSDMGENVEAALVAWTTTASTSIDIWHVHLGHISVESILKMAQNGMAKGMDVLGGKDKASTYCKECEAAGHT